MQNCSFFSLFQYFKDRFCGKAAFNLQFDHVQCTIDLLFGYIFAPIRRVYPLVKISYRHHRGGIVTDEALSTFIFPSCTAQ